jgi:flagellar motor switch protein FliM
MAAELMIGRLEVLMADHLGAALAVTTGRAPGVPVPPSRRCAARPIWRFWPPFPRSRRSR